MVDFNINDDEDDYDPEDVTAEIDILDSIQKLAGVMKKDLIRDINVGVLSYGALALKRYVDMLVVATEDRIMLEIFNATEGEDTNEQ
jgi:hypothetical protein